MKNYLKPLLILAFLISFQNLATAQYPIKKIIDKDTVVILTVKQADLINESYDVYKKQLDSLSKVFARRKDKKQKKYKELEAEHTKTLAELSASVARYEEQVKKSEKERAVIDKIDRNAVLVGFAIGLATLILVTLSL